VFHQQNIELVRTSIDQRRREQTDQTRRVRRSLATRPAPRLNGRNDA
jgi:hypothetical protein